MRRLMTMAGFAAALALSAAPGLAQAQYYHHHHRYHRCKAGQRHDARVGTVLGAIVGGVAGNAVGGRGPGGTIVGAGVGAVAGHQIAKGNHPC
jgi:hypothetical protein